MRPFAPTLAPLALALALALPMAHAQVADPAPLAAAAQAAPTPEPSAFETRYFGTLGYATSSSADLRSRANLRQAFGSDPSGTWLTETRGGAQIDWRPSGAWSATAMIYCEKSQEKCPRILWAYAKWDFAEDYSLKIGRFRMAPFLGSEAQEVGYLTTWARNPVELYNIYPADDIAGLHLEKVWSAPGGGEVRASAMAGTQSGHEADVGAYNLKVAGVRLRGSWPNYDWVLAANHYKLGFNLGSDFQDLADATRAEGYTGLAESYNTPVSGWLYSAGGRWSPENSPYFVQGELGYRSSDKLTVQSMLSGYAMVGARHGKATYFATRGFARTATSAVETRGGDDFNPIYQSLLSNDVWRHDSWTVGGRYEIDKHWAAKAQLGWHRSSGAADNTQFSPAGSTTPAGSYKEAILTLDFLF